MGRDLQDELVATLSRLNLGSRGNMEETGVGGDVAHCIGLASSKVGRLESTTKEPPPPRRGPRTFGECLAPAALTHTTGRNNPMLGRQQTKRH